MTVEYTQVSVENKKYTVVIGSDGSLKALRHGEPWQDLTGNKLIYCLAAELDEARKTIAATKATTYASEEPADLRFSWMDFQQLSDEPAIEEATRNFLDDPTEDNSTCMVRAICEAAAERLVALAASQAPVPAHAVPPGYALIHEDALRAWGKLDEVRAACVYPVAAPAAQAPASEDQHSLDECNADVFERGESVCMLAVPKEQAEAAVKIASALTGDKYDWHYFGGRVHVKRLAAPAPAPVDGEVIDAKPKLQRRALGVCLKKLRLAHGLLIHDVAVLLNFTSAYLSQLEHGREPLTAEAAMAIATWADELPAHPRPIRSPAVAPEPLTNEQILNALRSITNEPPARLPPGWVGFARAIERAHGIGVSNVPVQGSGNG